MAALFEKDLRLILIRKSALYIYLVIGALFTWTFSSSFSGAYMTMLGTMLALSTLSYDLTDNCIEFVFTLPCTRKQFVIEKYLFVYAFSFVAGLLGLFIIIAVSLVKGDPINATMILEVIASELPIIVIACGIMIPLQLKFGPERARTVFIVIIGALFIIGFLISKIPGIIAKLNSIENALNSANPIIILMVLVVALFAISAMSIMITMRIMDKKEF